MVKRRYPVQVMGSLNPNRWSGFRAIDGACCYGLPRRVPWEPLPEFARLIGGPLGPTAAAGTEEWNQETAMCEVEHPGDQSSA